MSALEDRRQNAREAAWDITRDPYELDRHALQAAIEAATRVRITPEIIEAAEASEDYAYVDMIKAAFGAAGFEVVE